jgi:hypothetical protein
MAPAGARKMAISLSYSLYQLIGIIELKTMKLGAQIIMADRLIMSPCTAGTA